MAIVYIHKRKDNNKVFYIGIGKSQKRAFQKESRNNYWKNIVAKHGLLVEITHNDIVWEEAERIEMYLISFWKEISGVKICNLTDGGGGVTNIKLDKSIIKKRNAAIKSAWNDERKKRYKEIFSGENNPFYGKKHSELSRLKISKNQNPRKFITEDHKQNISKGNKGKKRTEEVKKKLSDAKKGKPNWRKGKICSQEHKEKIRQSVKSLYTDDYRKMISEKTKEGLKKYFNNKKNEIYNRREANNSEVGMERVG